MRNRAYVVMLLALGLGACGSDSGDETNSTGSGVVEGTPIDVDGDGISDGVAVDANGDGIVEGVDTNNDGIADKPLPQQGAGSTAGGGNTASTGSQPSTNSTGGGGNSTTGGGVDIFQPDGGASSGGTTGGIVVVNSKAKVNCGGSESELDLSAKYTCCETWTTTSWSAMVKAEANCVALEGSGFGGIQKAEVASSCDSKDDCGGGSYCCFFLSSMGPPKGAVARPYGRKCMSEATCNSGGIDGGGAVFSCNTVADCPSAFKECVAETKGEINGNTIPRAWVKVCK